MARPAGHGSQDACGVLLGVRLGRLRKGGQIGHHRLLSSFVTLPRGDDVPLHAIRSKAFGMKRRQPPRGVVHIVECRRAVWAARQPPVVNSLAQDRDLWGEVPMFGGPP